MEPSNNRGIKQCLALLKEYMREDRGKIDFETKARIGKWLNN